MRVVFWERGETCPIGRRFSDRKIEAARASLDDEHDSCKYCKFSAVCSIEQKKK